MAAHCGGFSIENEFDGSTQSGASPPHCRRPPRCASREQRQLSAAYARSAVPVATTTDWNAALKASADARATAADQVATNLQALADFHTARAAKGGAQ